MKVPGRVKGITGASHKQKMGSRDGSTGEKTAKDVRFNVKVRLGDREVDRLRDQHSIKGNPKGSKKARAGNDMRQTLGT